MAKSAAPDHVPDEAAEEEPAGRSGKAQRDYKIEALAKGLRVLSLFSEQRPALRLSDVAAETGMLMPTIYRIAMTLEAEGYLTRLPDGRYRPGVKVLALGFSALQALDLVDLATGPLQSLAQATDETVNLGVLSEDKITYVVRIRNSDLVTANIQVGSRLPAVHGSMGKVLLAHLDEGDLRGRLGPSSFPAAAGPKAARTVDQLLPQLAQVRAQGYAVQDEEVAYGLRSVAAPIRNADGDVVAAANVAVNAMEWSLERLLDELRPRLVATATEISALLGARS